MTGEACLCTMVSGRDVGTYSAAVPGIQSCGTSFSACQTPPVFLVPRLRPGNACPRGPAPERWTGRDAGPYQEDLGRLESLPHKGAVSRAVTCPAFPNRNASEPRSTQSPASSLFLFFDLANFVFYKGLECIVRRHKGSHLGFQIGRTDFADPSLAVR
jgi:hypothetical protein